MNSENDRHEGTPEITDEETEDKRVVTYFHASQRDFTMELE